MLPATAVKYCQSCIQRGFHPPNIASREWRAGEFYCEDCFLPLVQNMMEGNVHSPNPDIKLAPPLNESNLDKVMEGNNEQLPLLDYIYKLYNIPPELQFTSVDNVCMNRDKLFNYAAPAVVNYDSAEELAAEIERRSIAFFVIKYVTEPLQDRIRLLKEKKREEKNLKGLEDSKEVYVKTKKTSSVKQTQEEKLAKTLGMSLADYQAFVKQSREMNFNAAVGNCKYCGKSKPCSEHANG